MFTSHDYAKNKLGDPAIVLPILEAAHKANLATMPLVNDVAAFNEMLDEQISAKQARRARIRGANVYRELHTKSLYDLDEANVAGASLGMGEYTDQLTSILGAMQGNGAGQQGGDMLLSGLVHVLLSGAEKTREESLRSEIKQAVAEFQARAQELNRVAADDEETALRKRVEFTQFFRETIVPLTAKLKAETDKYSATCTLIALGYQGVDDATLSAITDWAAQINGEDY